MDCPHIPELGYGEFSKRLHEKVAGQRLPIVGSMELTLQCNLRCKHCYLDTVHDGMPESRELTVEEYREIFRQLAEAGTLWLLLTGGEPLLRPDFDEIYLAAKRAGFIITLFTNGTLITPRLADLLAEWRPFQVEITLYGLTQATYERVTGIPGSHKRCMTGIELLKERGIPFNLKTIAMTLNVHELEGMKAFAESLGVGFRFDPIINAGVDARAGARFTACRRKRWSLWMYKIPVEWQSGEGFGIWRVSGGETLIFSTNVAQGSIPITLIPMAS